MLEVLVVIILLPIAIVAVVFLIPIIIVVLIGAIVISLGVYAYHTVEGIIILGIVLALLSVTAALNSRFK